MLTILSFVPSSISRAFSIRQILINLLKFWPVSFFKNRTQITGSQKNALCQHFDAYLFPVMRIDIALDLFYLPMDIATVRLGLLLQKLNVFSMIRRISSISAVR